MNDKHRIKVWYLLLNIIVALVTLSLLAGLAVAILLILSLIVFLIYQGQTEAVMSLTAFGGLWVLLMGIIALLGIVLPLGNALFSYLQTGSTGLELRIWPFYRLQYGWHQVSGVEQVKILGGRLSLSMLRIKKSESPSQSGRHRQVEPNNILAIDSHGSNDNLYLLPLLFIVLLARLVKSNNLIPVYIFKGWPNGKLRQALESRLGPISFER